MTSPNPILVDEKALLEVRAAEDLARSIELFRPIDQARAKNRALRLATSLMVMSFANQEVSK